MKLNYTTRDGRITVEIEGTSDKELFRKLAHFQEIFEDSPSAVIDGKQVNGGDVIYRVRRAKYTDEKGKEKEAEYFEKLAISGPLMWFKKAFGILDDGSDNLFPKRPAEDENLVLGQNGWHKYKRSAD
jgi:hypothetical protein